MVTEAEVRLKAGSTTDAIVSSDYRGLLHAAIRVRTSRWRSTPILAAPGSMLS
jgi:hypothetical protein